MIQRSISEEAGNFAVEFPCTGFSHGFGWLLGFLMPKYPQIKEKSLHVWILVVIM